MADQTCTSLTPAPGWCPYCSMQGFSYTYHGGACPKVRAIEYHPNGAIKRVEFNSPQPANWPSADPGAWVTVPDDFAGGGKR